MNTNPTIMAALQAQFPVGSPNITVSDPWVKKAETCTWKTDSNLVHHFEDTVYEPTNDICSLSPGEYTWIVTSDYQISIGRFPNTYEFTSKHANLALMRTGYVAGELAIIPATSKNKEMKGWNLLSVRYPPSPVHAHFRVFYSRSSLFLFYRVRIPFPSPRTRIQMIQWPIWRMCCIPK